MSRWQAVIFDLDDTLYPERQYVESGMRAVAVWAERELDVAADRAFEELWQLFVSGVRGNTFNHWLELRGPALGDHVAAMVRAYRDHEPRIAPYPGVRELLAEIGRECRLGLVTDGYLTVQRRKVAALGLESFFHAIVYSDQWGREAWKPSPRPFEAVLRRLRVEPYDAVYVGDNPAKDFRGARRLGMGTIRVRHADGLHYNREPAGADNAADMDIHGIDELMIVVRENRAACQKNCRRRLQSPMAAIAAVDRRQESPPGILT